MQQLNFTVSSEAAEGLNRLVERTGLAKSELARRLLALGELALLAAPDSLTNPEALLERLSDMRAVRPAATAL